METVKSHSSSSGQEKKDRKKVVVPFAPSSGKCVELGDFTAWYSGQVHFYKLSLANQVFQPGNSLTPGVIFCVSVLSLLGYNWGLHVGLFLVLLPFYLGAFSH